MLEARTYHPEPLDTRGAVLSLRPEERFERDLANLSAYAQVWALGFMCAVETWPGGCAAPLRQGRRCATLAP